MNLLNKMLENLITDDSTIEELEELKLFLEEQLEIVNHEILFKSQDKSFIGIDEKIDEEIIEKHEY